MSHEDFVRACGPVFEKSPWIAAAVAEQRPFQNFGALLQALCDRVRAGTPDEQLSLIRAHPDLAGRMTLTTESQREQAAGGLTALTASEIELFRSQNEAYRRRFGFPFIICARLNQKDTILAGFGERLKNSPEKELQAALEEIFKIAELRLRDLCAEN